MKCPSCGAQVADGLLCAKCAGKVQRDLRTIRQMWPEMTMPGVSGKGGGRSADIAPLLFNEKAIDASDDVRTRLAGVVAMLDMGDLPADDVRVWCRWLGKRIVRIGTHEAAADIVAEIATCRSTVLRYTGRGREDSMLCGWCPTCGEAMYADVGKVTVTCSACRKAGLEPPVFGTAESRAAVLEYAEDELVSHREAIYLVKRQTLNNWIRRGKLQDRAGWIRYGDLLDCIEGMKRRSA